MDDNFWMLLARDENEKIINTDTEPINDMVKLFESPDETWQLENEDQFDGCCSSTFDALDENIEDSATAAGNSHSMPSYEFDHGYSTPHDFRLLEDVDPFNLLASPSSSSPVSTVSDQADITNSSTVAAVAPDETNGVACEPPNDEDDGWCDVGYTKFNFFKVTRYFPVNGKMSSQISEVDLERDFELSKKCVLLEPGTLYKFRIAAITEFGRGPWTESGPFKTRMPGLPSAPTTITISNEPKGALISWDPSTTSEVVEYVVYLASRGLDNEDRKDDGKYLSFVQVYCGTPNHCIVPYFTLASAQIFSPMQPAMLFRIAAKNEKGFGPVTQVRWLQPKSSLIKIKRPAEPQPSPGGRTKKRKDEIKTRS